VRKRRIDKRAKSLNIDLLFMSKPPFLKMIIYYR